MVTQSKWQKKREECKPVMLDLEWKKMLKEKGIEVSELLSVQKRYRDREVRREQARQEKARLIEKLTEKEEERILEIGFNLYLKKVEESKIEKLKAERFSRIRQKREIIKQRKNKMCRDLTMEMIERMQEEREREQFFFLNGQNC